MEQTRTMNTQSTDQAFNDWIESPAARKALNLYTGPNQLLKNIARASWIAGAEAQKAITRKEVVSEIVKDLIEKSFHQLAIPQDFTIRIAKRIESREAAREGKP